MQAVYVLQLHKIWKLAFYHSEYMTMMPLEHLLPTHLLRLDQADATNGSVPRLLTQWRVSLVEALTPRQLAD